MPEIRDMPEGDGRKYIEYSPGVRFVFYPDRQDGTDLQLFSSSTGWRSMHSSDRPSQSFIDEMRLTWQREATPMRGSKPELLPRVQRAERCVEALMQCFEMDIEGTPNRIARFWDEFNQPCDLTELMKTFDYEEPINGGQPMVVVEGIPFSALCEHHACPFFGHADIGYIPAGKVLGLSKFARLVHAASHVAFTIQERLTNQITEAIQTTMKPHGTIVVMRSQHTCMTCRGINTPGVWTTTSAVRGAFVHNPAARQEFFNLTGRK